MSAAIQNIERWKARHSEAPEMTKQERRRPNPSTTGSRRITKALRATAYHEAGHAVVAWLQGHGFKGVSIVADEVEGSVGRVTANRAPSWFRPDVQMDRRHRTLCEMEIRELLAGFEAERRFTGRRNHVGASRDLERAADYADWVTGGSVEEVEPYLDRLSVEVALLFDTDIHWRAVQRLAEELVLRGELSGSEARSIIAGGDYGH
jgi:hypothetical protein